MLKNILSLAAVAGVVLCGAGAVYAFNSTLHKVDQKKLQFDVTELTIKRGDMIEFTNSDRTAHNIYVQGGGMFVDSGLQQPGQPTTVPFTKSGKFQVACAIHPKMKLDVTVED